VLELLFEEGFDVALSTSDQLWQVKNADVRKFPDNFAVFKLRNVDQRALV